MGVPENITEEERAAGLREAEDKAIELFEEIKTLIRPGLREKELNDKIHALGAERHNVRTHWHKRVIRSGPNTLRPFEDNPPDRVIEEDDILVVDLGPVFEEWEADFGRTYVLGNDPEKQKLVDALEPTWIKVKGLWEQNPSMTAAELYAIATKEVESQGYKFGAFLAGHIVGNFPHERIPKDKQTLYIVKDNETSLASKDKNGKNRHWILEIHIHDAQGRYGGFYEQLLTA